MRAKIVFLVILGMLVALVYLIGTRVRDPHVMPDARAEEAPEAAVADAALGPDAPAVAVPPSPAADAAGVDGRAPLLDRPLRLVAASWELAATALVANGGRATADGSAVRAAGLELQIEVVPAPRDVEGRLARGGIDPEGADVAVVSLPALVASYERLRALEPEVVHVVGWSRGREVLLAAREGMLAKPAAAEVDVASDDLAAGTLALFALDASGTPPARVHVAADVKVASFAALARPLPADRPADAPARMALTTADASRLVPFVAVAARGFVEGHADAVAALLRAWAGGSEALRKDVPAAARRIAAEPGAPDPAAMLERLSWIGDPGRADEARALGVAGHDAVTVATLFALDWRLLREAGTLSSPAPDAAPIASGPFSAALASSPEAPPPPAPAAPAGAGARVLLVHRLDKGDADALAADVAWLAGVFERSTLRVSARPASLAKDAAGAAHDKLGIAAERVTATATAPAGPGVATVEVLAAP
ncbi:MAG TPA: hypothetical protein VIF15_12515 [Polyangiaceae bacterium]|jgi:hypothetical protein